MAKGTFNNPMTRKLEEQAKEQAKKQDKSDNKNSNPLSQGRGPIRVDDDKKSDSKSNSNTKPKSNTEAKNEEKTKPKERTTPSGTDIQLTDAQWDVLLGKKDEEIAKKTESFREKQKKREEEKRKKREEEKAKGITPGSKKNEKTAQEKYWDEHMKLGRVNPNEVLLMGKGPVKIDKLSIRKDNFQTKTNLGERAGLDLVDKAVNNYVSVVEREHTFTEEENARKAIDDSILQFKEVSPEGYEKHRQAIDYSVKYALDKDYRTGVRGHNNLGFSVQKYAESTEKGDTKSAEAAKQAAWADVQNIKKNAPKYYAENAQEILRNYSQVFDSETAKKNIDQDVNAIAFAGDDFTISWLEIYNNAVVRELETGAKKASDFDDIVKAGWEFGSSEAMEKSGIKARGSVTPEKNTDMQRFGNPLVYIFDPARKLSGTSYEKEFGASYDQTEAEYFGRQGAFKDGFFDGLIANGDGHNDKHNLALYMTDDEKNVFTYLYMKDIENGIVNYSDSTAKKYFDSLTPTLNQRITTDVSNQAKGLNIGAGAALRVFNNLADSAAMGRVAAAQLSQNPVDKNSQMFLGTNMNKAMQEEWFKDLNGTERFFAGIGLSIYDNLTARLVTANTKMPAVLLPAQAFTSAAQDSAEKGITNGKSFGLSATLALSEAITETIKFDSLDKAAKTAKVAFLHSDGIKSIAKAGLKTLGVEGASGTIEETANEIVAITAEMIFSGKHARIRERYTEYKSKNGEDKANAVFSVALSLLQDLSSTAISGFISESMMGMSKTVDDASAANKMIKSANKAKFTADIGKSFNNPDDVANIIKKAENSGNDLVEALGSHLGETVKKLDESRYIANKIGGENYATGILDSADEQQMFDLGLLARAVESQRASEVYKKLSGKESSNIQSAAESALENAIADVAKTNSAETGKLEATKADTAKRTIPLDDKKPKVTVATKDGGSVTVNGREFVTINGRGVYIVDGSQLGASQKYYAVDASTGKAIAASDTNKKLTNAVYDFMTEMKKPDSYIKDDIDSFEEYIDVASDIAVEKVETGAKVADSNGDVEVAEVDSATEVSETAKKSGDDGKKTTVTLISKDGLKTYEGVSVAEDTGYELTAVERNGGITIVEKRSGMEFAHGATVEEAVANVRNKIAENGKDAVDAAIEKAIERRKASVNTSAGSTSPIEGDRLSVGRAVADADYTNTLLEMAKTSKNEKARKAAALYSSYDFKNDNERYRALGDIAKMLGVSEADLVKSRAKSLFAKIRASISSETDVVDKTNAKIYEERQAAVSRGDTATVKALDYLTNLLNSEGSIISVSEMFAPNQYSAENPNVAVQVYGKRMETAFKNIGLDISVSVYYDSSENAARGEWTKHPNGHSEIKLNGAKLQGEQSAFWVVSHELIHEAESKSPGITQRMLDAFTKMGMYDGSQYEAYKARYSKKCEADFKKALDRGDVTQDDHDEFVRNYVNEEIVADLMSETMSSSELVEVFAGKLGKDDANVIVSFLKWIKNGIKSVFNSKDEFPNKFSDIIAMFEGAVKGVDVTKTANAETRNALSNAKKDDVSITQKDVDALRSIGRKSVNNFTSEDIKKAEPFARRMFKELRVKSPFFRAWFGDWRVNDITPISPVEVGTIDLESVVMENGDYDIQDTKWTVHAGVTLKEETEHYARGKKVSVRALSAIKDILNNAILFDTEVSVRDSKNKALGTALMHKLYTPIVYGGKTYIAKVSVEEFLDTSTNEIKRKAYHLKGIKIETADGRAIEGNPTTSTSRSDTVSIKSISDLFNLVKTYDKDFSPKELSKVVNADGTPKVVYHGTDKDFDVFIAGQSGGIFFAGDRNVAEKFTRTGKVEEVYLDIKKPFVIDALVESEFMGMKSYKQSYYYEIPTPSEMRNAGYSTDTVAIEEVVKYAKKSEKYDGVIIENVRESDGDATTDYIVFDSTQVKSATDNIGTFDKNNPNKRYSLDDTGVYSLEDAWAEMTKKYGAIPKGEKVYRDTDVSKNTTSRAFKPGAFAQKSADSESAVDDVSEKTEPTVEDLYGEETLDDSYFYAEGDKRFVKDDEYPEMWETTKNNYNQNQKNVKVRSPQEIVSMIQKLYIPVYIGHQRMSQDQSAAYEEFREVLVTKSANNLPAIFHDLGHHLDKLYDMTKLEGFSEVAKEYSKGLEESYSAEEIPHEAAAEFVRHFLMNNDEMLKKFPTFTRAFSKAVGGKMRGITKIANAANAYMSASEMQRLNVATVSREDSEKMHKKYDGVMNAGSDLESKILTFLVDVRYPIDKVFRKAGIKFKDNDSPYRAALETLNSTAISSKMISGEGFYQHGATSESGKGLVRSLTSNGIKTQADIDALNDYLTAKHAVEWIQKGKRVFADDKMNTVEAQKQLADKLEKERPYLANAAKAIYKYRDNVIKYGIEAGIFDKDTMDTMRKMYPAYVPFWRDHDYSKSVSLLKHAKGSGRAILSPIENLMVMTKMTVSQSLYNRMNLAFADAIDTNEKTTHIARNVTPSMKKMEFSSQETKEKLSNALKAVSGGNFDIENFETVFNETIGEKMEFYAKNPAANSKNHIITAMRDGIPYYYQVRNADVYNALTRRFDESHRDIITKIGDFEKKLFTDWSPTFLPKNAFRDIRQAYARSTTSNPFKYLYNYFSAFVEARFKSKGFKAYLAQGGGYGSMVESSEKSIKKLVKKDKSRADIERRKELKKAFADQIREARRSGDNSKVQELKKQQKQELPPAHMILRGAKFAGDVLNFSELQQAIEQTPRYAEFKISRKTGQSVETAIYKSKNVTTMFGRKGTVTPTLNKWVIFSNAMLQSTYEGYRILAGYENDITPHARTKHIITQTTLGVLATAFTYFMCCKDDEDREDYEKLSAYMKYSHYVFPIGDGKFIRLPKANQNAIIDTLLTHAMLEKLGMVKPEERIALVEYLLGEFNPGFLIENIDGMTAESFLERTALAVTANIPVIGTATELLTNKDFLYNPIVPEYMSDWLPEEQYYESTSEIAKKIGAVLKVSPLKVDSVIEGLGVAGDLEDVISGMFVDGVDSKDVNKYIDKAIDGLLEGAAQPFTTDNTYSNDLFNLIYDKRDEAQTKFDRDPSGENKLELQYYSSLASYISKRKSAIRDLPEDEQRTATRELLDEVYLKYYSYGPTKEDAATAEMYDKIEDEDLKNKLFKDNVPKTYVTKSYDIGPFKSIKVTEELSQEDYTKVCEDIEVAEEILKMYFFKGGAKGETDEKLSKILSDYSDEMIKDMTDEEKVSAYLAALDDVTDLYIDGYRDKYIPEDDGLVKAYKENIELGNFPDKKAAELCLSIYERTKDNRVLKAYEQDAKLERTVKGKKYEHKMTAPQKEDIQNEMTKSEAYVAMIVFGTDSEYNDYISRLKSSGEYDSDWAKDVRGVVGRKSRGKNDTDNVEVYYDMTYKIRSVIRDRHKDKYLPAKAK